MSRKAKQTYEIEQNIFPVRLSKFMKEKNITQTELAKNINVTRQAISLYANGQSTPDINILCKIAKYFKVSSDYLLGLSNSKSSNINDREVCSTLGLTDESIETLKALKNNKHPLSTENYLRAINDFISYSYIDGFLDFLIQYVYFDKSSSVFETYNKAKQNIKEVKSIQYKVRKENQTRSFKITSDKMFEYIRYMLLDRIKEYGEYIHNDNKKTIKCISLFEFGIKNPRG